MKTVLSVTALSLLSFSAFAGTQPAPVPEPATLALFGIGAVGYLLTRKGRK